MKIVFLSHLDLNLYLFRRPVMEELLRRGHDVYAVVPPGSYREALEEIGVHVTHYALDRGSLNPLRELAAIRDLRKVLHHIDPDIVHAFTHKPNLYAAFAAPRRSIRTVTGLGSFFTDRSFRAAIVRGVITALYRIGSPLSAGTIFQNRDDLELFVGKKIVSARQARLVLGSGVDTEEFGPRGPSEEWKKGLGIDPNKPAVLMIARVIREKGVREYIEAASRLADRAEFLYLGEIDRGNPNAMDPDWGPVRHLGFHEDVQNWIAASDLVVLPSYREGLPRTLLEAASMGKALVATDVPGCREIVRQDENGLLVPAGDSRALAEAIRRLLADPELRETFGRASRRIAVEEFDISRVVERYIEIYEETLQ